MMSDLFIDFIFSVRAERLLKNAGIDTLKKLDEASYEELLGLEGFGEGCMSEVNEVLDSTPYEAKTKGPLKYALYVHINFEDGEASVGNIREQNFFSRQSDVWCLDVLSDIINGLNDEYKKIHNEMYGKKP